jgi:hypothetical protein
VSRLVLGIDPGLTGALCLYGEGVFIVRDMPIYKQQVGKRLRARVDMLALADMIDEFAVLGVEIAVLESVGGRPGQSASAGFVFGYTVGLLAMGLMNARIPLETVSPQVWKKAMKMPGKALRVQADGVEKVHRDDKNAVDQIRIRGDELFPEYTSHFRGKQGGLKVDRIEAAALALFGYRHVLGIRRPDVEWRMAYRNADTGA